MVGLVLVCAGGGGKEKGKFGVESLISQTSNISYFLLRSEWRISRMYFICWNGDRSGQVSGIGEDMLGKVDNSVYVYD